MNPKQEAFCREYSVDHNGAAAAIRAGYTTKAARQAAKALLTKTYIRKRIEDLDSKHAASVDLKAEDVLRGIMEIAFCDIADAVNGDGSVKRIKDMDPKFRRSISGVDVEEIRADGNVIGYVKKLRFWDKNKALENLGRHLELFTDKVQMKNTGKPWVVVVSDLAGGNGE